MKKLMVLFLLVCLLAGCAGQTEVTEAPTAEPTIPAATEETEAADEELQMAPDFAMEDGIGSMVSLSEFFGKPIVLNFWASWCGPCKSEMPDFEEAYQKYGADVQFIMVNLTDGGYETLATAKSFVESSGFTFPVYYDTASEGANTYGISSIPRTYFIDAEGMLVAYASQMIDAETLEYGISLIYSAE